MSYSTDINSRIKNLTVEQTINLLAVMNVRSYQYASGIQQYRYGSPGKNNIRLEGLLPTDKKDSFVIKNTDANKLTYNLYDIVAGFKAMGRTDEEIAEGLNKVSQITPPEGKRWTSDNVKTFNAQTTHTSEYLQAYLDRQYPNSGAKLHITLDPSGDKYNTRIEHMGADGDVIYTPIEIDLNKRYTDYELNNVLGPSTNLGSDIKNNSVLTSNLLINTQADYDTAQAVIDRLKAGGLKTATTNNDLTPEVIDALTAAAPSTDNLDAWNQTKDSTVFQNLITNIQRYNPELLKRIDYDTLKGISDEITNTRLGVTERNIKNKQANALNNINRDTELYEAVTKQLRADSAAGTIAGQRAANAQGISSEADTTYDKQASDLYASLFGGEGGNIAQQTYAGKYKDDVTTLDTIIQGKLNDAVTNENLKASQISKMDTMLQALADATGIDVARWADAISEAQAEKGGKATSLVDKVKGDLTTAQSSDRANLDKAAGLLGEEASYYNQSSDGSSSIANAAKPLQDEIAKPVASSGYTVASPGDYQKAEQFANQQYSDLITSPEGQEFLKWILNSDTIDAFTKQQTIGDFMKAYELDDLTLDGLTSYYEGYNKEATTQANKVFNQAQRAYIAAITAGDAKTAEQLIKLASSANTSKGNLYAASALANQFKQQTGALNSGRQLATDFLNQQDFNRGNKSQAQYDAATAQLKYLGDGNQQSSGATLYEAYNKAAQNNAQATGAYGKFGSNIMGRNQDMSSWAVKNNIDNWNRLVDVASAYTNANAQGAAHNTDMQGEIETLRAQALAKQQQALQTNPNLKK